MGRHGSETSASLLPPSPPLFCKPECLEVWKGLYVSYCEDNLDTGGFNNGFPPDLSFPGPKCPAPVISSPRTTSALLLAGASSFASLPSNFHACPSPLNPILAPLQVVAVAARDLSRAKEFAQKHNIPKAYGSYEELAKDPNVGEWRGRWGCCLLPLKRCPLAAPWKMQGSSEWTSPFGFYKDL